MDISKLSGISLIRHNVPEKLTFKVPNKDTHLAPYSLCPKEVLQKGYTDKIGGTIDYCGVTMKVVNVRITDDYIFVDLER